MQATHQVFVGAMVKGRPDGERSYSTYDMSLLDQPDAVHWIYNRIDADATAIVCGIAANSQFTAPDA